jgi:hypothetical protein
MAMNTIQQEIENMEYVRRLLERKQPGFAAALELAALQLERELREPVVASRNGAAYGRRPLTPAITVTPASCAASVIMSCTWRARSGAAS